MNTEPISIWFHNNRHSFLKSHSITHLCDLSGREGVGLADVRAGLQVLAVDVVDHVGPSQAQEVVVAAHVLCAKLKSSL